MKTLQRVVRTRGPSEHRIIGIDPSLSSTGFAYRLDGQLYTGRINPGNLTGPQRLLSMRQQLEEVLDHAKPTIVVYEGYAFGARGKNAGVYSTGELGGVLKLMMWERGLDVMLVPPTTLKLAIVGKGNADRGQKEKPEMRDALHKKFGYLIDQNDEADAFALMLLGEIRYIGGLPEGVRKQLKLDSLRDCAIIKGRKLLKLIANE